MEIGAPESSRRSDRGAALRVPTSAGDLGDPVEEADELVDDLLCSEVQLAVDRGEPDLGDAPRERVRA
jgi:hypothetical protein